MNSSELDLKESGALGDYPLRMLYLGCKSRAIYLHLSLAPVGFAHLGRLVFVPSYADWF